MKLITDEARFAHEMVEVFQDGETIWCQPAGMESKSLEFFLPLNAQFFTSNFNAETSNAGNIGNVVT